MVMLNPKGALREDLETLHREAWNSKLITTRFIDQVSHMLFKASSKGLDSKVISDVAEKLRTNCLRYSNATQLIKACLIARYAFQKMVLFIFPDSKEVCYPEYIVKALSLESGYFKTFFSVTNKTKWSLEGILHEEMELLLKYLGVSDFNPNDPEERDEIFSEPGEHAVFSFSEKQNILRIATDFDMQRIRVHVEAKIQKEGTEEMTVPLNPEMRLTRLSPLDMRLAIHLYTTNPSPSLKKMCEVYFSFVLSSRFPQGAHPLLKKIRKGNLHSFTLHPFPNCGNILCVVIDTIKKISDLSLRGCSKLSKETLESIFTLKSLNSLDLTGCVQVDDDILEKIGQLSDLNKLIMNNLPKISSAGIERMGAISYELTEEGLIENRPLSQLMHLEVDRKELLVNRHFDFAKQHPKTFLVYA